MGTKFKEILPVTFFGKETKELQRNSTKKNLHFQVISFVRHKMGFKTKYFFLLHQTMKLLTHQ